MDDLISRQAAWDAVDSETVSTNPEHFKSSEKFIEFMDDTDIASFGKWQWANGFNTALVATTVQLKNLPSAERRGRWILLTNELPEIGDRTLVTVPSIDETFVTIGTYAGEHRWYIGDYGFCEKVIAWLPLPKPYKEGE